MSNYTDTFRKPAMTDETGIAIAEKLGGDTASEYKVNTSAEYRKAPMSDATAQEILAKIDGGGGLPEVTEDDNGDVLTVVEGAWAKAEPSGGGQNILIITGSWSDSTLVNLSMTYSEMQSARQNGAFIFIDVYNVGDNGDNCIVRVPLTGNNNYLYGTGVYVFSTSDDDTFYVVNVYMNNEYQSCYVNTLSDYT